MSHTTHCNMVCSLPGRLSARKVHNEGRPRILPFHWDISGAASDDDESRVFQQECCAAPNDWRDAARDVALVKDILLSTTRSSNKALDTRCNDDFARSWRSLFSIDYLSWYKIAISGFRILGGLDSSREHRRVNAIAHCFVGMPSEAMMWVPWVSSCSIRSRRQSKLYSKPVLFCECSNGRFDLVFETNGFCHSRGPPAIFHVLKGRFSTVTLWHCGSSVPLRDLEL